jgi:hypothetical protein
MDKIEIKTPAPEKLLPILQDAITRQKQILIQSLARTEEKVQYLASQLNNVDITQLLEGRIPHPEDKDLDLVELEGEVEILHHLRDQLESLDLLSICP